MLAYYNDLLKRFELDSDAYEYLVVTGDRILSESAEEVSEAMEIFCDTNFSVSDIDPLLASLSEKSGINRCSVDFIFLAAASRYMREEYLNRGYSETLFWDTVFDLKYKLKECLFVKGVLGIQNLKWYQRVFRLEIITIGRLQYEKKPYPKELYAKKGVSVRKGDPVYSVHIPSSGPLTEALRYDSYKRAYDFLMTEADSGPLVCICNTWLLYEENRKIFPADLNAVRFIDDWDIIENKKDEAFEDAWRLFGVPYNGDTKQLPQKTVMQKSMVKWLEQGGCAGIGFGVLVYDGEKLL